MDPTTITHFIASTRNVFETMLNLQVQVGKPAMYEAGKPAHDVSGIIGLSGDVEGAVILSFPTSTAERVVNLLTGGALTKTDPDFADAVGELVNMISGGAKAKFQGAKANISCPSVIIGSDHVVFSRKDATCIAIPCSCDCGEFVVQVALRDAKAAASPANAA